MRAAALPAPVIDHLRRPLIGASLQEVDARPVGGEAHPADIHAVPAQGAEGAWPMTSLERALTNTASAPSRAREAATLASPPPNCASSRGDWNRRSCPGDLSRSMTSPKVTIFFMDRTSDA